MDDSREPSRNKKRPPWRGQAVFSIQPNGELVDGVVDRREHVVQVGADRGDDGDDGDADEAGDQAVLDGGCAGLTLHETRNQVLHLGSLELSG